MSRPAERETRGSSKAAGRRQEAIEVYSRQLTFEAFSILTVNCKLWTVNSWPCGTS